LFIDFPILLMRLNDIRDRLLRDLVEGVRSRIRMAQVRAVLQNLLDLSGGPGKSSGEMLIVEVDHRRDTGFLVRRDREHISSRG